MKARVFETIPCRMLKLVHPFAGSLAASVLLLAGCANFGRGPESQVIDPSQAGLGASSADQVAWPITDWWLSFGDPQLDALIKRAQADNPSIKTAQARVRLAQQTVVGARSRQLPTGAFNGRVIRERFSENYLYPPPLGGSSITDGSLSLDFSYEFDFWGKQRAALQSANSQEAAAHAETESAKLIIGVAVAQTYISLQRSFEELAIAEDTLQQRNAVAALLKMRVERGLDGDAEVETQRAALFNVEQDAAAIRESIDLLKHQLAALTGQGPRALDELTAPRILQSEAVVPTAIPLDLLGRRPDIVAQRLRIEASAKDIVAAKAEFYPNIDLSASLGLQSLGLDDLFKNGSRQYSGGLAVHLPIFNRGALRANLGTRYADYDLAVEQYNQTVLDAARDVADQSVSLRAVALQRNAARQALAALQRAYDLDTLRYRKGLTNYLTVLNAQTTLFTQRRTDASLRERELQAALSLIKALGGGYLEPQTAKN